jgi:hypothetical protein
LHAFFSLTFSLSYATTIIRYLELRHLDVCDDGGDLTTARALFAFLQLTCLGFAVSAAAKGVCVISDRFPVADIALSTFFCASTIVFWFLPTYVHLDHLEMASLMLSLLTAALFFREILLSLTDSVTHVWIHLIAIGRSGIEPRSTPVFQRFTMLKFFRATVYLAASSIAIYFLVSLFYSIPYSVQETIEDAILLSILFSCGIIFRIRKSDLEGQYGQVGDTDEVRGTQPSLESLDLRTTKLPGGGLTWHPGMWLPVGPTEASAHYGHVRPKDRRESIDIAMIDEMSVEEDPLTSSG